MKKIILFLILSFISISPVYASSNKVEVTLSNCVDGDTARFMLKGEEIKVRFLGINTPESVKPNTDPEAFGKEASKYTCNRLKKANKIELEYEKNSDKEDKYGRTLAYVFVDDKLLEELVVKKGYAEVKYINKNYKYYDTLIEAEKYAKNKELGIYSKEEVKEEKLYSEEDIVNMISNFVQKYIDKLLGYIFGF